MLAGIGYRYFYLVYLIAFAAIIGVKIVLIETPPVKVEKSSELKLNKMVFVISFASFVHTLFINAYNTNIGIYILQNITDDPSVTSVVTAVNAAFALLWRMFFGKISGFFKTYTLSFSIICGSGRIWCDLVCTGNGRDIYCKRTLRGIIKLLYGNRFFLILDFGRTGSCCKGKRNVVNHRRNSEDSSRRSFLERQRNFLVKTRQKINLRFPLSEC